MVEKVKEEMEESVRKDGEAAAFELGLFDLHPEICRLDGTLEVPHRATARTSSTTRRKWRFLAGIMAREWASTRP